MKYEKGNLEIHSADAGINTDSDSNNARGNELYSPLAPERGNSLVVFLIMGAEHRNILN